MKRQSLLFLSMLLLSALLLSGCEGAMKETAAMDAPAADYGSAAESYDDGPVLEEDDLSVGSKVESNRKLIRTAEMRLETLEFDRAVEEIKDLVSSMGGYMEESYIEGDAYGAGYGRSASFTCRIPADRFASANEQFAAVGNVLSKSERADDVTDQYYDVEAELEALEIQQERLLVMMEQATEMEDLIALEEALTGVRYEINDRTGTIKRYDGLIQYATIRIDLEEVVEYQEVPPETFGDRIRDTFLGSVEFVKDFGEGLVLVFVAVAPFVVMYGGIAALIAGGVILIVKACRKKTIKQ